MKRGFTLLEILLVIAAIGILAAIVIVAINPQRQLSQVRDAERDSSVNTISNALNQYLIDQGSYPSGVGATELEVCAEGVDQATCASESLLYLGELTPDYIASIPREPQSSGNGAGYRISTDSNRSRVFVRPSIVELSSCPSGYVVVPGNSLFGTNDFCVMKYEAKVDDDGDGIGDTTYATAENTWPNHTEPVSAPGRNLVSSAEGYPVARIEQADARTACEAVGSRLMNNREWMTIAPNVESVSSNWTGGTVGGGGFFRGHTDNSPGVALEAGSDSDGYIFTGQTAPSIERRTLTLSNGEVIWDLSGNVMELLDEVIDGSEKPSLDPSEGTVTSARDWTLWNDTTTYPDLNYGTLSYDLVRPSDPSWGIAQNFGIYYKAWHIGPYTYIRGGSFIQSSWAGIYSLDMNHPPTSSPFNTDFVGIRCVRDA